MKSKKTAKQPARVVEAWKQFKVCTMQPNLSLEEFATPERVRWIMRTDAERIEEWQADHGGPWVPYARRIVRAMEKENPLRFGPFENFERDGWRPWPKDSDNYSNPGCWDDYQRIYDPIRQACQDHGEGCLAAIVEEVLEDWVDYARARGRKSTDDTYELLGRAMANLQRAVKRAGRPGVAVATLPRDGNTLEDRLDRIEDDTSATRALVTKDKAAASARGKAAQAEQFPDPEVKKGRADAVAAVKRKLAEQERMGQKPNLSDACRLVCKHPRFDWLKPETVRRYYNKQTRGK